MRKILIVDDEFLVRIGVKALTNWESHGYQIVGEAASGREALEKIEKLKPDIVLTDLKMDEMDGFELIAASRKKYPKIKFIVLSVLDDAENVKRAMKLGAVDYIFKLKLNAAEFLEILNEQEYEEPADEREQFVRKNISDIKRLLVQLASEREYTDYDRLTRTFKKFGFQVNFDAPYCVLMIRYAHCGRREERPDGVQILEDAIENMIRNVFGEGLSIETFGYSERCLVSVINMESTEDYRETSEAARERYEDLWEYGSRYANVELEGALSPCFEGIRRFSEAVFCCEKAFLLAENQTPGALLVCRSETRREIPMIKEFIRDNLSKNFTVGDGARHCHMSESYFAHVFKEETGFSFMDYVNRQRMAKARELLKKTDMTVREIAQAVGVENPNYFSVVFVKLCGESPSEYRSRYRFDVRKDKNRSKKEGKAGTERGEQDIED